MPCGLTYDPWNGDYDCSYAPAIDCDQCKFGGGRKDPLAWANTPEDVQKEHRKELRLLRRASQDRRWTPTRKKVSDGG